MNKKLEALRNSSDDLYERSTKAREAAQRTINEHAGASSARQILNAGEARSKAKTDLLQTIADMDDQLNEFESEVIADHLAKNAEVHATARQLSELRNEARQKLAEAEAAYQAEIERIQPDVDRIAAIRNDREAVIRQRREFSLECVQWLSFLK